MPNKIFTDYADIKITENFGNMSILDKQKFVYDKIFEKGYEDGYIECFEEFYDRRYEECIAKRLRQALEEYNICKEYKDNYCMVHSIMFGMGIDEGFHLAKADIIAHLTGKKKIPQVLKK